MASMSHVKTKFFVHLYYLVMQIQHFFPTCTTQRCDSYRCFSFSSKKKFMIKRTRLGPYFSDSFWLIMYAKKVVHLNMLKVIPSSMLSKKFKIRFYCNRLRECETVKITVLTVTTTARTVSFYEPCTL